MWIWMVAACDSTPSAETPTEASAPTPEPTEVVGTPADTDLPVDDCAAVGSPPLTWLEPWPEVATPQEDGSYLFTGDYGVFGGTDPWNATVVFETTGFVHDVRDAGPTVAWLQHEPGSGPEFWVFRRSAGSNEPVALGTVRTTFAVHPSGTVVLHGEQWITAVDAAGAETTIESDFVWDVAYDAQFSRLWVTRWSGLQWFPVDSAGVPDFSVDPVVVTPRLYVDIEVDRCDHVYGVRWDSPFAEFGPSVVERLAPDGTLDVLAGRREFLGDLRLSRDGSGVLSAAAGGYNSDPVRMEWEVGIDAP